MLQLVAGSGNAKYVSCCAPNSTCPGDCFLLTCLSSGLFNSLTWRGWVSRYAHRSCRHKESHLEKNYRKMPRSFRGHQLHDTILAPTALPLTATRACWDPCSPTPHLRQQTASNFKESLRNCSEEDNRLSLFPYLYECSKHLNLTAGFGLAWAGKRSPLISKPYPRRRILHSNNFYFFIFFTITVFCQHTRSLCDPGSIGSVQVSGQEGGLDVTEGAEALMATPAQMLVTR